MGGGQHRDRFLGKVPVQVAGAFVFGDDGRRVALVPIPARVGLGAGARGTVTLMVLAGCVVVMIMLLHVLEGVATDICENRHRAVST